MYEQNLSIANRAVFPDGRFFDWRIDLRQAEDPQASRREDVTLQGLIVTYGRPNAYEIRFGDVFGNLSRYAFTRSLEGLSGFWTRPGWKFSAITGRTARGIDGRSFQRYGHGARAAWTGIPGRTETLLPITIGANIAAAHDDPASAIGNLNPLDARVYSLDWNVPLSWKSVVVDGEIARTDVNVNTRSTTDRVGTALRAGIRGNPIVGWSANASMERVDPDAQSPLGSMGTDVFRWDASAQGRLPWEANVSLNFSRNENNIKRRLPATNISHLQGVNLSIPFLKRFLPDSGGLLRHMIFTAGARAADRRNSTRTFDNTTYDQNYGLSHLIHGIRISVGRNFQTSIDRITRNNDRRVASWNGGLSRDFSIIRYALVLSPAFTYSKSRDYGDRIRVTNRNQTAQLNLGVRWKDNLAGSLSYMISDRDQGIGNNDAVQTTLTANASYRLTGTIPGQLGVSIRQNRIDDERPTQDYTEREGQVTFNTSF